MILITPYDYTYMPGTAVQCCLGFFEFDLQFNFNFGLDDLDVHREVASECDAGFDLNFDLVVVLDLAGGRPRRGAADDDVDARATHRLLEAVHESRHQHHDQEAGEAEAGRLLVHGPALVRDLAVRDPRLRRRQRRAVRRQPLQPVRVADRGQRQRADLHERLYDPQ